MKWSRRSKSPQSGQTRPAPRLSITSRPVSPKFSRCHIRRASSCSSQLHRMPCCTGHCRGQPGWCTGRSDRHRLANSSAVSGRGTVPVPSSIPRSRGRRRYDTDVPPRRHPPTPSFGIGAGGHRVKRWGRVPVRHQSRWRTVGSETATAPHNPPLVPCRARPQGGRRATTPIAITPCSFVETWRRALRCRNSSSSSSRGYQDDAAALH